MTLPEPEPALPGSLEQRLYWILFECHEEERDLALAELQRDNPEHAPALESVATTVSVLACSSSLLTEVEGRPESGNVGWASAVSFPSPNSAVNPGSQVDPSLKRTAVTCTSMRSIRFNGSLRSDTEIFANCARILPGLSCKPSPPPYRDRSNTALFVSSRASPKYDFQRSSTLAIRFCDSFLKIVLYRYSCGILVRII